MSNTVDRVANRPRGEVANREEAARKDLIANVRNMESQFALAMPRGAEAAQLVRDLITCINANPKLAQCSQLTVLGAAMTMAQLGLRPGTPLGHGWILPFWNGRAKRFDAQLVIGYQGLVELAHRSGKVKSLVARTVHANDEYEVELGLDERLVHRPANGDRGDIVGFYAVVKLTTGGHAFETMTVAEVEAHRDQFAMAKTKDGKIVGPWRDNFEAMAQKTVVRKLAKWMPKGTDLSVAIAADETVRLDTTPSPLALSAAPVEHDDVVDAEAVDEPPAGVDPATGEVRDDVPVEDPPAMPADWPEPAQPGTKESKS